MQSQQRIRNTTEAAGDNKTTILTIERLVQVMNQLPVKDLFIVMSVNREWECAARHVIRTRTALVLDL